LEVFQENRPLAALAADSLAPFGQGALVPLAGPKGVQHQAVGPGAFDLTADMAAVVALHVSCHPHGAPPYA